MVTMSIILFVKEATIYSKRENNVNVKLIEIFLKDHDNCYNLPLGIYPIYLFTVPTYNVQILFERRVCDMANICYLLNCSNRSM